VLADAAVESVGPSRFLHELVETVPPGVWRDPAVLFCTPSPGLCWLWSALGFAEEKDVKKAFDVDELCLIAIEARLSAESGFDSQNLTTFGESLSLWDVDAAALSSCVLRAGSASCAGTEPSRLRCRQRSSSPRPFVFSDESRSRGRSLGAIAGTASCTLNVPLVCLSVLSGEADATDGSAVSRGGWMYAVRQKRVQKLCRRAALDAQFLRALDGLEAFDVCLLDDVRESPARGNTKRRHVISAVRADVPHEVTVRSRWRSRFSSLRRYKHTSDPFRVSVLRRICVECEDDLSEVRSGRFLSAARRIENDACIKSFPDAIATGQRYYQHVRRACEASALAVP
jgi:hypothetical protein